jgi:hypothetical protein
MPRAEWAQVAHDLRALAESIDAAIEPSAARADVQDRVPSRPAAAEAGVPPAPASAPQTALGMCPVHRVPWVVKDGGISKAGKPYPPFWKCKERDQNGYCDEKPTKAWADSHPIPVQAVEEVPF